MPYPAYPGPYATQTDLAGYWRVLSSAEQTRATVLLGAAADRINELPNAANFVSSACHWVSLDAVKRAMIVGAAEGVKSLDQSMAGMSVNQAFVNPMGALYITAREINRLRGRVGQSAGSVVLTSRVRVPHEPWNFQPPTLPYGQLDDVQWMRLWPEAVTLAVGAERHLRVLAATLFDYEDRTDYALFTSSNHAVAVVDNDGLVRATGAGSATVTATFEGFTDTCTVTVA
jgi:hypothetical protein